MGFNIYIKQGNSTFTQPTDAIKNSLGGYPTVANSTHTRTNFTIKVPTQTGQTYQNGTLYYVTVTAYGTNDLTDTKYIETKINAIVPVIPRMEGDGTGNTITANSQTVGTIDKTQNLVTASAGWQLQYFGPQSDFNAVVVITNKNFYEKDAYYLNGLYIFSNTGQSALAKVWLNSSSGYRWAYHNQASQWNGI